MKSRCTYFRKLIEQIYQTRYAQTTGAQAVANHLAVRILKQMLGKTPIQRWSLMSQEKSILLMETVAVQ